MVNPTVFWLVRHGQTDWNVEGRFQGQSDVPLNEAGEAEVERASRALARRPLAAIVSSDLRRATATAWAIAEPHGLTPRLDPRLREIGLGVWEGMLFSDIREQYAGALEERKRSPETFASPEGEALHSVEARAMAVVKELAAQYPGAEVALVSHGVTLAVVWTRLKGDPLSTTYEHSLKNAAPERVEWNGEEV